MGTHPYLVSDDIFFSRVVSEKEEQAKLSKASITISNILLGHSSSLYIESSSFHSS